MTQTNDQMGHVVSDDNARFTAMYDQYRQRVWAYAVSRAGRGVADDAVSETFTVAWRRIKDVPDDPLPWLLGVARNGLRTHHRGGRPARCAGRDARLAAGGGHG